MRHIRDRDDHDMPARVFRVCIGFREHRIVVIARVHRIDGQQRNAAQIRATGQLRRLQIPRLVDHALWKIIRNAVRVHRNQRHLALVFRIAERFHDARPRRREPSRLREFEAHEIAVLGVLLVTLVHRPGFQFLAVDRLDRPAAPRVRAIDAEQPPLIARQLLDRLALELEPRDIHLVEFRDPRHHVIADARHAILVRRDARERARQNQHARLGTFFRVPDDRFADQIAVAIAPRDFQRHDGGQRSRLAQFLARTRKRALVRHHRQETLQRDLVAALDAERARDLALADLALRTFDESQHLLARRHPVVA